MWHRPALPPVCLSSPPCLPAPLQTWSRTSSASKLTCVPPRKMRRRRRRLQRRRGAVAAAGAAAAEAAAAAARRAPLRRLGGAAGAVAQAAAQHLTPGLAARAGGLLVLERMAPGAARAAGLLGLAAPVARAVAARAGLDLYSALPQPLQAAGQEVGQLGKAAAAVAATRLLYAGLQHQRRRRRRRRSQAAQAGGVPVVVEAGGAAAEAAPTPGRLLRRKSSVNCEPLGWKGQPWKGCCLWCVAWGALGSCLMRGPSVLQQASWCSRAPFDSACCHRPRLPQWRRWAPAPTWALPSSSGSRRPRPSGRWCTPPR